LTETCDFEFGLLSTTIKPYDMIRLKRTDSVNLLTFRRDSRPRVVFSWGKESKPKRPPHVEYSKRKRSKPSNDIESAQFEEIRFHGALEEMERGNGKHPKGKRRLCGEVEA
jgi:hypothetical protein